jgi:pimeloyl-ACP methyl ester carboxylesterase
VTTDFLDRFVVVDGGLRLHYRDYAGAADMSGTPVVCLPGLTRNCRDFDALAPYLAASTGRRILAPDLRGRGGSDHDPEWRNYRLDVYVRDLAALLDAAGVARVVIIGTSLGGLVGMFFASGFGERVAGLVLNDIGPELEVAGMLRIATTVGTAGPVTSWEAAAAEVQAANASAFPDFGAADWMRFARRIYREEAAGRIVRDFDPNVGRAVREPSGPVPDFWATFAALRELPMICLRGELSDLLGERTVQRMTELHPLMQFASIPRRGHAPTLDEPQSRAAIDRFLSSLS